MRRCKALKWALSFVLVFAVGASCDSTGCEILQPMPNGNEVPVSQTIEGGMQVRVTADGFDKISAIIPPMLENSGLGNINLIDEFSAILQARPGNRRAGGENAQVDGVHVAQIAAHFRERGARGRQDDHLRTFLRPTDEILGMRSFDGFHEVASVGDSIAALRP